MWADLIETEGGLHPLLSTMHQHLLELDNEEEEEEEEEGEEEEGEEEEEKVLSCTCPMNAMI